VPTKKPVPLPIRHRADEARQGPVEPFVGTRNVDVRLRARGKPAQRKGRVGSRADAMRMARTRAMRAAEQERHANRR
jgi:hypothetical protein